jgi:hypothetical protein
MLGLEAVMAGDAVLGHAHDRDARGRELGMAAGEVDLLFGAARGVVLGVEIEHERPPLQVGQAHAAAAIGGQIELWRLLSGFERHVVSSSRYFECTGP